MKYENDFDYNTNGISFTYPYLTWFEVVLFNRLIVNHYPIFTQQIDSTDVVYYAFFTTENKSINKKHDIDNNVFEKA